MHLCWTGVVFKDLCYMHSSTWYWPHILVIHVYPHALLPALGWTVQERVLRFIVGLRPLKPVWPRGHFLFR